MVTKALKILLAILMVMSLPQIRGFIKCVDGGGKNM